MTVQLVDPVSGSPLEIQGDGLRASGGTAYPIIAGVPRICDVANYTESFGKQWNLFARTQIDDPDDGRRLSEVRFFTETAWLADDLDGLNVLEVGSGAGRFSRVVLRCTKANLWSVDYSTAVEANMATNGSIAPERFHLLQASVYEMPFPDGSFDRIFCFGVLQHTPDFEKAVRALIAKAKKGGEIVVDFYARRHALSKVNAKYLLRPVTKRMDHDRLLALINRNLDWLMATSVGLTRAGLGVLTRFLPLTDLRLYPKYLTKTELREWVLLDTFDMFSPQHDNPQRIKDVRAMFERHGARVDFADHVDVDGTKVAVVRGTRI